MKRGWLVVFAKAPASGRVKTRFSPPFTAAEAVAFYRCLLADVLDVTSAAARSLDLEAVLCVDPPAEIASLSGQAPEGFRAIAQDAGALGERMARAAHRGSASGAPLVLLRGSDSPCLGEKTLREAVAALAQVDLVICPDRDGGYNLVGLGRRALAGRCLATLFDHPMSTPTVLEDTLERARRLELQHRLLSPGFDLDRFEDLRWLAAERHSDTSIGCARTLAFLDEHSLWPDLRPRDAEQGKAHR